MTLHVALASAGHPLAHATTQSALPWWSFGKTVLAAAGELFHVDKYSKRD